MISYYNGRIHLDLREMYHKYHQRGVFSSCVLAKFVFVLCCDLFFSCLFHLTFFFRVSNMHNNWYYRGIRDLLYLKRGVKVANLVEKKIKEGGKFCIPLCGKFC